jgi:hypothetical protein
MRPQLSRRAVLASLFGVAALGACSNPPPPVGRWEGVYEDAALIVAVRLEIAPTGEVRVSAPNAILGDEQSERGPLRARLLEGLARSWPQVGALPLDFDGKAFHKPGGVAPQLEWDAKAQYMTMIYYSGNRSSVRVPLTRVEDFGRDS